MYVISMDDALCPLVSAEKATTAVGLASPVTPSLKVVDPVASAEMAATTTEGACACSPSIGWCINLLVAVVLIVSFLLPCAHVDANGSNHGDPPFRDKQQGVS